MSKLIIFDVDDEVIPLASAQGIINQELFRAGSRQPLRIVRIDDLSDLPCDCRRPSHRPHRRVCATRAVERNGGHPQLLFFMAAGREYRASAIHFNRP